MPRSMKTGLRDPEGWALAPGELEGTPSPLPPAQGSTEDMCKDGPCICTNQLAAMLPQRPRNTFPIPLRNLGWRREEGKIPHLVSSWSMGSKVTHPSYICPQVLSPCRMAQHPSLQDQAWSCSLQPHSQSCVSFPKQCPVRLRHVGRTPSCSRCALFSTSHSIFRVPFTSHPWNCCQRNERLRELAKAQALQIATMPGIILALKQALQRLARALPVPRAQGGTGACGMGMSCALVTAMCGLDKSTCCSWAAG